MLCVVSVLDGFMVSDRNIADLPSCCRMNAGITLAGYTPGMDTIVSVRGWIIMIL